MQDPYIEYEMVLHSDSHQVNVCWHLPRARRQSRGDFQVVVESFILSRRAETDTTRW